MSRLSLKPKWKEKEERKDMKNCNFNFLSDAADRAGEMATAKATAFLVGVAGEARRRDANNMQLPFPWPPWPPWLPCSSHQSRIERGTLPHPSGSCPFIRCIRVIPTHFVIDARRVVCLSPVALFHVQRVPSERPGPCHPMRVQLPPPSRASLRR